MTDSRKPPPAKFGRSIHRAALTSLSGILAEMARIYRRAKTKTLDHEEARSLIWMLGQMRAAAEALELERLHGRLDEMDAALTIEEPHNGHITQSVPLLCIEDRRD